MRKISFLILVTSCVSLFSCRKEMGKPSWDTEVLTPLVHGTLNINNILPDSVLQTNADSSMKIVFNNNLYNLTMDTIFKINDTTLTQGYALPIAQTMSTGLAFINNSTTTTYQLPGVELRKVIIKSGKVRYSIKNKVNHIMNFKYSIPSATLGGNAFAIDIDVPSAVSGVPGVYDEIFDLSGYTLDLTGPFHNQINTIYTSLLAKISTDPPASVVINPQDSLVITNTFFDIIPYYAKGYFGQNTFYIGPSESNFTMFNRIVGGTLQLEHVNFNFNIENPIGLDARMYVTNLNSTNTRTNHSLALVAHSLIGMPININRASESGTTVYPTYANFPLTTNNSNIKPFIENLPDKLGYSIKIMTNPLGNVSGSNDFIYSDKLLKASMNMEIPLSMVAHDLTLMDTLAMSIASPTGAQNLHSGTLTLFADNGFPFDASVQLYMLNDNNAVVDSIFGYANTIVQAPINASYRVIDKKLTKIVLPISEAKMNEMYTIKKVALKVKFNTAAQPNYVKIYSDYTIDVNLVGDLNYTIHLN